MRIASLVNTGYTEKGRLIVDTVSFRDMHFLRADTWSGRHVSRSRDARFPTDSHRFCPDPFFQLPNYLDVSVAESRDGSAATDRRNRTLGNGNEIFIHASLLGYLCPVSPVIIDPVDPFSFLSARERGTGLPRALSLNVRPDV